LVGLRRHRYDWRNGSIAVVETLRELNGTFSTGPPKTRRSQRVIPLPRHAVAILNDHLATYDIDADGLIFTTPQETPISRANFRGRISAPACARARIRGLRFHDLRHTHASWLLADGIPVVVVSQRLGHASVSMTLNVYAHVMPTTEDRLLTVLDGRFAWGNHGADGAPSLPVGSHPGP
jgi:integrase